MSLNVQEMEKKNDANFFVDLCYGGQVFFWF